jgi:hypothetical protein
MQKSTAGKLHDGSLALPRKAALSAQYVNDEAGTPANSTSAGNAMIGPKLLPPKLLPPKLLPP